MNPLFFNKKKIINDPVYGFINIPDDIIFDLIEHPYFQRLRRIKQLGLTYLVYPGATHTRFNHAIGAMHLMNEAMEVLRSKGHSVSEREAVAANTAILLHDIGHGPFSHALESGLISGVHHELISEVLMNRMNREMGGKLDLALKIYRDQYEKKYFHQMVSGQLDVDRLDYLNRDSFFTGVSEGIIGSERIIKMLNLCNGELVVEHKGIYSIEKFILARRLMYWQVYLHKTVLSAEKLLINILRRARWLAERGEELFAPASLHFFLYNTINSKNFDDDTVINHFIELDDDDIFSAIKVWKNHSDKVLATLCSNLQNRRLYRIEMSSKPISEKRSEEIMEKVMEQFSFSKEEASYFVFSESISNSAYVLTQDKIKILLRDGSVVDFTDASSIMNPELMSHTETQYFLCYPKECAGC
ncbi:MAG: HD domain-containing protein [Bacteroidota bacterium]